eukprot:scaffold39562_cov38-Prasinocladus_malaysianus.AAC.3
MPLLTRPAVSQIAVLFHTHKLVQTCKKGRQLKQRHTQAVPTLVDTAGISKTMRALHSSPIN